MASSLPSIHIRIAFWVICLASALGMLKVADGIMGWCGAPPSLYDGALNPPHQIHHVDNVEFSYDVVTNGQGIRYHEVGARRPGVKRIVLLGDSYAEGAGVSDSERWSSLVEAQDPKAELVNCGWSGTGPFDYARTLFHVGFGYQPDAVVMCIFGNDVLDCPETLDLSALDSAERYPPRSRFQRLLLSVWPHLYVQSVLLRGRLINKVEGGKDPLREAVDEAAMKGIPASVIQSWKSALPADVVAAWRAHRTNPSNLWIPLDFPDYLYDNLDLKGDKARRQFAVMMSILDRVKDRCQARGIPLAIVYAPWAYQFDTNVDRYVPGRLYKAVGSPPRPEWATQPSVLEAKLREWSAGRAVPFMSLAPAFRTALKAAPGTPLNYSIDNHWTPAGHQVAAAAMHAWLRAIGFLPTR